MHEEMLIKGRETPCCRLPMDMVISGGLVSQTASPSQHTAASGVATQLPGRAPSTLPLALASRGGPGEQPVELA